MLLPRLPREVDHVHPVAYLRLNHYWKRGILLGLALSLLNFLGMLLRFGPPHPSMQYVTWNSVLSTSILIGLFEEIRMNSGASRAIPSAVA